MGTFGIDHITLENIGFVRLGKSVSVFGLNEKFNNTWGGRFARVHFSISHPANHSEMNFHVTRNFKDAADKPKIVVFKIGKPDIEPVASIIAAGLLNKILIPVRVIYNRPPDKKSREKLIRYVSFDEFERTKKLGENLRVSLQSCSTVKQKRRLRISNRVGKELSRFDRSKDNLKLVKNLMLPIKASCKKADTGFLITSYFQGPVIRMGDDFYKINQEVSFRDLFDNLLGERLRKHLIFKFLLAVGRVSESENYKQTEKFYDPVLLTLNKQK